MTLDYELLGKRLAKARKRKKLTQETLAEQTNLANNYISNIENSRSIPSLETLMKLCTALDVTPNEILLGSQSESLHYLQDEILENVKRCSPREKRLLNGFLLLLFSERDKE